MLLVSTGFYLFCFTSSITNTSSNLLNLELFHRVVGVVLAIRVASVKRPARLQSSLHWLLPSERLHGARNLRKRRKAASESLSFGVCCLRLCRRARQLTVMHTQLWICQNKPHKPHLFTYLTGYVVRASDIIRLVVLQVALQDLQTG